MLTSTSPTVSPLDTPSDTATLKYSVVESDVSGELKVTTA